MGVDHNFLAKLFSQFSSHPSPVNNDRSLTLRITLAKQKQLGMESIQFYCGKPNSAVNSEDGLTNAILFIDFKKGFDTINHEIPHKILLSKLELDRFKGASLNFFRDYLSDRTLLQLSTK